MDRANVWVILTKPDKPLGKKGTKFIQKNNENTIETTKKKKYKIALETDLIIKNGKIARMIEKTKIKLLWLFLLLLVCRDDFIIELYMKKIISKKDPCIEAREIGLRLISCQKITLFEN